VDLEQVVVTAARLPPGAGEAAFSAFTVRPGETVQVRLDEALKAAPGVSLFRRSSSLAANPTTQGLSLRSIAPSGAGRALVTLDGAPQNDPFGGWVIWTQLPPETIETARIVRGAGSGPYGAGALTGVVALEERSGGAVFDAFAAERGGARAAGAAEGPVGGFRALIAGSYERSDGYTPVRGARRGAADTPTDLEASTLTGRLTTDVGFALLSLRANAYREERGAGLQGARSTASGASASLTAARVPSPAGLGWRLQAWSRRSDLANTSVAVAAGRTGTTPANDQFETPATGAGLNAALRRRGDGFEWEVGLDARAAEGEVRELFRFVGGAFTRDRLAGGRTGVAGAYAEGTWTSGAWLLTGGLRADAWSSSAGVRRETDRATGAATLDERPADADGLVPTGRAGARVTLAPGLFARAAAYAGFRPPTLNELHRPFRVGNDVTEANSGLEPERLYGAEAGLSGSGVRSRWSLGLFANRLEDPIANVTVGFGPGTFPRAGFIPAGGVLRQRRNAGAIDAVGLEAEVERDLGAGLSLRGALSATYARVDGGVEAPQLKGKRPAQAPIWTATAGAAWRPAGRLSARADLRWESARFEDDLNTRRLGAGLLADAAAEFEVRDGVAAYLAAENLFAAELEVGETADGVEQYGAPQTVRLGLRLTR
jgi:outer membrane receptor protein involved in Fe transport